MNTVRLHAIEELKRLVLAALSNYDAEVWLFGSCARGDERQHSDIDIAVLPGRGVPENLLPNLAADIEESVVPYDVDLVDLRYAAPELVEEVRREGEKWRG